MPELPEVQTVLDGLVRSIAAKKFIALKCYYPGTVITDPEIGENPFPAGLDGFERRGKYILLHLTGGHSIIIHLRMTGKLVHGREDDEQNKHERACFLVSDSEALHFIDPRTFGKIVLCRTANLERYIPALGREPLSKDFDASYLAKVFSGRRLPIKSALLDQRMIAGLGNIYVNEILYRCRINPDTPAGELRDKDLKAIARQTKLVLEEAIAKNGTSISDFRRIDDKTGEFQNFLQVYQKTECPKGHAVHIKRHGGRSTFYCPICQK